MKNNIYWPAFLIIAVLSTAAVWQFAPVAPIPDDCRAWCVKVAKRMTRGTANGNRRTDGGRTSVVESRMSHEATPSSPASTARPRAAPYQTSDSVGRAVPNPPQSAGRSPRDRRQEGTTSSSSTAAKKNDSAGHGVLAPQQSVVRSPRDRRQGRAKSSSPAPTLTAKAPAQTKVEELAQAEKSDEAIAMTPAQRKQKYEELSKKAEARRLQIIRENLTRSAEGRKALAAVKAFKDLAAKVDNLKKKYGETDSRVVSKRGDLLKLKDEVRRTNEAYKKWKEKHPDQFIAPETDKEYRKIIGERQLYTE